MLVLARKPGEAIVITLPDGRTVTVTHLGQRRPYHDDPDPGERVLLGFSAPREIPITRAEALRLREEVPPCSPTP